MMNRIIIEGPKLTNARLQVKDIDEAIEKLHELKASQKCETLRSIQRFRGIVKPGGDMESQEEEWYLQ